MAAIETQRPHGYQHIEPPLPNSYSDQPLAHQRCIYFRHPAYPRTAPPLLSLPAVDGGDLGVGIHYQTAIIACGIITGNQFQHAWFGQMKTSSYNNHNNDDNNSRFERCDEPPDGILRDDEYYFFVTDYENRIEHEFKYPVIPSFDHWRFPHNNIPEPWSKLTSTLLLDDMVAARVNPMQKWNNIVTNRDRSCRISGYREGCEIAHLVPSQKGTWFLDNGMTRYSSVAPSPTGAVNDSVNAVLLRSDLHKLFDSRRFAFVPKGSKLVVHQMQATSVREIYHLYHNRALQPDTCGILPQFLLARFAWCVLCDETYTFLKGPQRYAITMWNPERGEASVKTMSGRDIANISQIFATPTKSRSVSPRKRKQEDRGEGENDDECDDIDDDDYDYYKAGDSISNVGEHRGRSRTRKWHGDIDVQDCSWNTERGHRGDSLSTISGTSPETPINSRFIDRSASESLFNAGDMKDAAKDTAAMSPIARKRKRIG